MTLARIHLVGGPRIGTGVIVACCAANAITAQVLVPEKRLAKHPGCRFIDNDGAWSLDQAFYGGGANANQVGRRFAVPKA